MALNVEHLLRTANTLEQALLALRQHSRPDDVMFDLFRNAAIKSFELSLETAGKLLRKALKAYSGNPRSVDALVFNDVLRQAGRHGLLDQSGVERWLAYRANRNNTAHDYGQDFANHTLTLLPDYLQDVRQLAGYLESFTKPSEAILARRVTADSTKKYGKVTQQRQEGLVSGSYSRCSMPAHEPISLDLAPRHLQLVLNLLCQHTPHAEVWAYGSRVSGGAQECSDLDLVLRLPGALDQPVTGAAALTLALQESLLPISVDIHQWAQLPESFRRNIDAAHIVLQTGQPAPG